MKLPPLTTKEHVLYLTPEGADLVARALLLYEHSLGLQRFPHPHDPQEVFHVDEILRELSS